MKPVRVIPCLDVKDGRVVKGVNFENLKDAGDIAQVAAEYNRQHADELFFLDIAATLENRKTMEDAVIETVKQIDIPLTVGGGIQSLTDIERILEAGASRVSIASAAIKNPGLISEAAKEFGSGVIVAAMDAKKDAQGVYEVYIGGGTVNTGLKAVGCARELADRGAGEILLTSKDADGTKDGYDLELTALIAGHVNIPVIASGGAGKLEHFAEVVKKAHASAVLAASLFHFQDLTVPEVKAYLKEQGISVNL